MRFVSLSLNEEEINYLSKLVLFDCFNSGDHVSDVSSRLSDLLYEAFERVRGTGDGLYVFTSSEDLNILNRAFTLKLSDNRF